MPAGLRSYLPRLRFLMLDENRLDLERPELAGNRVASLFLSRPARSPTRSLASPGTLQPCWTP